MKFIPFILSLLVLGNEFYLSEIFILIGLVLNYNRLIFKFKLVKTFLSLFLFLSITFSFYFHQDFLLYFFGLVFSLFCFFNIELKVYDNDLNNVINFLKLHLFYAFFLFILAIFFGIEFSSLFELPLYGLERSVSGSSIAPYYFNGFPIYRIYGLTSEPSLFGSVYVLILSWISFVNNKELPSFFLIMFILSMVLSLSLGSIFMLIVFLFFYYKKFGINKKLKKYYFFSFSIILIILLYDSSLRAAVAFRSIGRINETFQGTEGSAFLRLNATWGGVYEFLKTNKLNSILFGISREQVILFLENISFIKISDFKVSVVSGQRGSAIALSIYHFGFIGSLFWLLGFFSKKNILFSCIILVFLFYTTYFLTFGLLILLILNNTFVKYDKL